MPKSRFCLSSIQTIRTVNVNMTLLKISKIVIGRKKKANFEVISRKKKEIDTGFRVPKYLHLYTQVVLCG